MKVAIVGGPSTGKSTLVKQLAKKLRKKRYKVGIVDDPAREYIKKWIWGKRDMVIADQYWILKDWLKAEEEAKWGNFDFILCDGASFLAYNYCFLFPGGESFKDEISKMVMENLSSYDYIFFLPTEFPPKKEKGRLFTDKAYIISLSIRAFLDTYLWQDLRWLVVRGKLKQRVKKVLEIILK